jgi:hypothetical protein
MKKREIPYVPEIIKVGDYYKIRMGSSGYLTFHCRDVLYEWLTLNPRNPVAPEFARIAILMADHCKADDK